MRLFWRGLCAAVLVGLSVSLVEAGGAVAQAGSVQPLTTSSSDLAILTAVSVQPADLASGLKVQLYGAGTSVHGYVSLDLCRGPFPSEELRTGRYQVAVVPESSTSVGDQLFSVEAIMYQDDAAARQAMTELATAAKLCPASEFVLSGVAGDPPTNWQFNPAPDTKWKKVHGVQRLAYDATLSDQQGASAREHFIYQRHGRIIVGMYGTPGMIASAAASPNKGEQRLVDTIAHRLANTRQEGFT